MRVFEIMRFVCLLDWQENEWVRMTHWAGLGVVAVVVAVVVVAGAEVAVSTRLCCGGGSGAFWRRFCVAGLRASKNVYDSVMMEI